MNPRNSSNSARCACGAGLSGTGFSGAVLAALFATFASGPVSLGQEHAAPREVGAAAAASGPVGAIGRMIEAAGAGDTVVVPPGLHREHLRITKPITIDGMGLAIIDGGGAGDIIEISAPDVTIRGLTVRNTGIDLDRENAAIRALAPRVTIESNVLEDILFGIDLREAPDSRIIGNTIGGKDLDIARRGDGLRLWRADRTVVEGNTIHSGRDAILWYSTGVVVRGNTSHDCRYGLHLMFSDDVTITDNELRRNSVGVYLMYSTGVTLTGNRLLHNRGPSGYGIGLKETDKFSVRDNLIIGNRAGVYIDGSPFSGEQPGLFTGNTFAYNDVGITFLPSARGNEIVGNNFIDNIDQVAVAGRGGLEANRFWKGEDGNFWSDYTGYDQNRDGVGDFVHESQTFFDTLTDRHPALRLFLFSPAQQAIEFVGRAIPAVRPEPLFTDEVPLMRPVAVRPAPADGSSHSRAMLFSGAVLTTLGLAVLSAAVRTTNARRAPHAGTPTKGARS